MSNLRTLFEEYLVRHANPSARLETVEVLPGGNQGYSGSIMIYYALSYRNGQGGPHTVKVVTKDAPVTERRILQRLSEQRLPGIAPSHTLDLVTDRPMTRPPGGGQPPPPPAVLDLEADASMLVCQKRLEGEPLHGSAEFKRQAAINLAAIHAANLGKESELGWLPPIDDRFYAEHLFEKSTWLLWEENMQIPEFVERYGHLKPTLEQAEKQFRDFVQMLREEGSTLTLIHADLHGDHVLADKGQPYIIDWGQAGYGSLYLDLPNYFSAEEALVYRAALAELGHEIPESEFLERYREAGRYVGFKYLSFCLWTWRAFEPKYDDSRLGIIQTALHGSKMSVGDWHSAEK